jgi:hypothetical protein
MPQRVEAKAYSPATEGNITSLTVLFADESLPPEA